MNEKSVSEQAYQIEQAIKMLPIEIQGDVRDFINLLLRERLRKSDRKLRQDWAGALKDYRDQYTSLELQMKAREWRSDQVDRA